MSPVRVGISGYLVSHQSSHLLACFAARSGRSRISRMARVGFRSLVTAHAGASSLRREAASHGPGTALVRPGPEGTGPGVKGGRTPSGASRGQDYRLRRAVVQQRTAMRSTTADTSTLPSPWAVVGAEAFRAGPVGRSAALRGRFVRGRQAQGQHGRERREFLGARLTPQDTEGHGREQVVGLGVGVGVALMRPPTGAGCHACGSAGRWTWR